MCIIKLFFVNNEWVSIFYRTLENILEAVIYTFLDDKTIIIIIINKIAHVQLWMLYFSHMFPLELVKGEKYGNLSHVSLLLKKKKK